MKNRKIIQIFPHSLSNFQEKYLKECNNVIPYDGGWHSLLSKEILKYTDQYEIECWGMEKTIKKLFISERNSIKYKIYPSIYLKNIGEFSFPLVKDLSKVIKNEKVILHIHGAFNYSAFMVPIICKGYPVIVQVHGDKSSIQEFWLNLLDNKTKSLAYLILYLLKGEWIFERVSLKNVDKFFVLNEQEKAYLSSICSRERIEKSSMGVDFEIFKKMPRSMARKEIELKPNYHYILYVGSFVKLKGLDYLIRAFSLTLKDHSKSILLMVGTGYYKSKLKKLIDELHLVDNVIFIPWVENKKLPFYYSASNVVVLPSLSEGLGLVGIEAMACETPFIGTSVGGIPEVINTFGAGMLVPPKNPKAISEAINHFLVDNHFSANRENAKKQYSWEAISRRNLKAYDELWEKYYG